MARRLLLPALLGLALLLVGLGTGLLPGSSPDPAPSPSAPSAGRGAPEDASAGPTLAAPGATPGTRDALAARVPLSVAAGEDLHPLEGDGLAYARPPGARPGLAALVLPVRDGRLVLGDPSQQELELVAVRVDPAVYRVRSEHPAGPWTLERRAGHLLDVRTPEGLPADDLDLRRGSSPAREAGGFHPGRSFPQHRLQERAGSPLWVELPDLATPERTLYVRGDGQRWEPVDVTPESPGALDVALAPGGSLEVRAAAPERLEGLDLRVLREGARPMVWRPLDGARTTIAGLPPGELRLVLGPPNVPEGQALVVRDAEVRAGETTVVDLFPRGELPPEPGHLTGSLDLSALEPDARRALGRDLHLVIVHDLPHDPADEGPGLGKVQGIVLDRMDPDPAHPDRLLWRSKPLPPGGLRVVLHPFGQEREAWLEPGGSAHLDLVLEPLASATVRFVDPALAPTSVPAEVQARRLSEAFGSLAATPVRCTPEGVDGVALRITCAPGAVVLTIHDAEVGVFQHELDLPPGPSEHSIGVGPAHWLTLEVRGPDGPVAPGDAWWDSVALLRGGSAAEVLTRAFPFDLGAPPPAEGFSRMRVCVRGPEGLTVVPPQHPELGPVDPVHVPGLDPEDGTEPVVVLEVREPR